MIIHQIREKVKMNYMVLVTIFSKMKGKTDMMNKREEDILDDILDSEESEDSDENEMKLPETLMGESMDDEEGEENEEPADPGPELDLSKFLDDDDEEDDEKKPDEAPKKSARELDREELEREIRAKIAQEKKEQFKIVKKIAVVCAALVLVIGIGMFAFFQVAQAGNNYIMKFDGKKIGVAEFEFFMLYNILQQVAEDKQSAYNGLLDFLILNKAAKDRNVLTDEEKALVKSNAEDFKNTLKAYNIELPKISDARLEEIVGIRIMGITYYKLLDIVAEESGYTVDENDLAAEFAAYQAEDKLLKYIITGTPEEGEAAREALASGMAADEAIKKYSMYYETYGIDRLNASDLGFDEENYNAIMRLGALEFSDVINLGGGYAVFIATTSEETREWFRADYMFNHKNRVFSNEYELWKSEAKEERNDKVFEAFDVEEFFNRTFGG